MVSPDEPSTVSILLLGDPECGKSTLLSRLRLGHDDPSSDKSALTVLRDLDQPFVYDVRMYSRPYRFEFYDTSSPENWTLLLPDVVVLCFDICERSSLDHVRNNWRKAVYRHFQRGEEKLPVLLLGLKRDLRAQTPIEAVVDPQEAYRIAAELRCDRYAECSALTGELVKEVFEDIARVAAKTTTEIGGQSAGSNCVIM